MKQTERENGDFLKSLTKKERYERTSYESFLSRGNVLRDFHDGDYRIGFLTKNEMPYTKINGLKVKDHLTLWTEGIEYFEIIISKLKNDYYNYTVILNSDKNRSVDDRRHIHLLLLEN